MCQNSCGGDARQAVCAAYCREFGSDSCQSVSGTGGGGGNEQCPGTSEFFCFVWRMGLESNFLFSRRLLRYLRFGGLDVKLRHL
jgi:hypothetical protein